MAIRDVLFDVAPEFETTDETTLARVDRFIDRAATEINRSVWGDKADLATALLAAHSLAMRTRGGTGAAGNLTSRKNGDFAETYSAGHVSASQYGGTTYGQEFERLRGTLSITPIVL